MNNADGWVTIGTRLDSKQLEKDLKNEEKKLSQFEKEAEKLTEQQLKIEAEIEIKGKELDRKIKEIEDRAKIDIRANVSGNYAQRAARDQKIQEVAQQKINSLTEQYNQYLDEANSKIENIENNLQQNAHQQGLVNNNIKEMTSELKEAKGFDSIKNSMDSIGSSVESVTKKVTRWALAIFGIRSAYLFIRQSMSTLSQYDDQLATNVEWIRYLLASALKPVIESIVNLAYKLLVYINYIAQAWFGVNLFANASLKAFQKQQKAVGGTTKKAKELQKTIAGFDEMNVLQDNKDTGSGGGAGGVDLPNFPKMEDVPIPGWVKWIAENKDTLIAALAGIAAGIVAIKLGAEGIMALGIAAIVAGIVMLIQDVIKFINDPSWQGFIDILADIAVVIGGIMLVMGNWWGLLVVIVGLLVKLVIDNWESIKGVLGVIGSWINSNVIQPVVNFFTGLWNKLKSGASAAWNGIKSVFSTVASFFKNTFTNAWNAVKKVFSTGGKVFTGIKDGILSAFKKIVNTLIDGINKVVKIPFDGINNALKSIKNINILGQKPFKGLISTISVPKIPKLAKGGVINNPGKGVYTGSAIAGEAGREFYMPLQDEQMLSLVGEAIGKYITVDLTNITNLDGRQIARKVEQINQNNKFVLNR